MKQSARWSFNRNDAVAAVKQAIWFLTPTLLVLIPSVMGAIPSDFKYAAITLYLLNRVTDLLRRWYNGPSK